MPEYMALVTATTNGAPDTDDVFLEWALPAGNGMIIRRVTVTSDEGTPADNHYEVWLQKNTAGGTGGITTESNSFRVTKKRSNMRATGATTVKCKDGVTGFGVGGGTGTLVFRHGFNERAPFEFIPKSEKEEIEFPGGIWVQLSLNCHVASRKVNVEVDWSD